MNNKNEQNLIQSTKVLDENRLSFLPKHLSNHFIRFESMVYQSMEMISNSYDGAYWEFYELSNGGFYMAPQKEERFKVFIYGNGYDGILSSDAAGIVATTFALNKIIWQTESEALNDKYYFLLDFAEEHKESSEIFSAID